MKRQDYKERHVLDHGYVKLVAAMGDDKFISASARVSYDKEGKGGDEKLINYLMKNKHTSPFESCEIMMQVKAPIFVIRQWHRHRTWSYNEVSARYTELPEEFYVPKAEDIGVQSEHNKQMRDPAEVTGVQEEAVARIQIASESAFGHYHTLLRHGVPRELARTVLPMNTYTKMVAKVDLHNLFHFLELRCHEHAQYEIRVYAEAILDLISYYYPIAVAAFKEHKLGRTD